MKTNLLGLALATAFLSNATVLADLSGVLEDGLVPVTTVGAAAESIDERLYAPADAALRWADLGSSSFGVLTSSDMVTHPSLAADLCERVSRTKPLAGPTELPSTGAGKAPLPPVPAPSDIPDHVPAPAPSAGKDAPKLDELPRVPSLVEKASMPYDISGIPHPAVATIASFIGVLMLLARPKTFA